MREQTLKDLGFEIQHETVESSGADKDWHFYVMDIGDICLITNDNEDADKHGWKVSILASPSCVIEGLEDLKDLIEIVKNNTK